MHQAQATTAHGKPLKSGSRCESSGATGAPAQSPARDPPTAGDQSIAARMGLAGSTEGVNGGAGRTESFPDSGR